MNSSRPRVERPSNNVELNLERIQAAIANGLPAKARWIIEGTTLDFDFSIAQHGLRNFQSGDPDVCRPADIR